MRRLQSYGLLLIYLLSFIALFIAFSPLAATSGVTFTVNSTIDAVDWLPGDGLCETAHANGVCTLRAAVQETNALSGADTIQLPAGTYLLTLAGIDTVSAVGDLDIRDDLTLLGTGANQTIIDGNQLDRVIHIVCVDFAYPIVGEKDSGASCPTNITVSISQVTIRNGLIPSPSSGGGIFNTATLILDNVTVRDNEIFEGTVGGYENGGGIANKGILTMTHSLVINNTVWAPIFGAGVSLGSVDEYGVTSRAYIADSQISGNVGDGITVHKGELAGGSKLTLERSLVSDNVGRGISHYGETLIINESKIMNNERYGIGIHTAYFGSPPIAEISNSIISGNLISGIQINEGDVTISNSTISNNSHSYLGGGLLIGLPEGEVNISISNTTITQNSAPMGAGIYVHDFIDNLAIINSIIAGNVGNNCSGVLANHSAGFNLEDGTDCNFTAPGDIQNTDPLLGPLQDNGGSTDTHALLPGSPAADAGDEMGCQSPPVSSLDQRRYSRVGRDGNMDGGTDGDPCDIGAFEISTAPTSVQLSGEIEGVARHDLLPVTAAFSSIILLLLVAWGLLKNRL